jgi:hypothetical protein
MTLAFSEPAEVPQVLTAFGEDDSDGGSGSDEESDAGAVVSASEYARNDVPPGTEEPRKARVRRTRCPF